MLQIQECDHDIDRSPTNRDQRVLYGRLPSNESSHRGEPTRHEIPASFPGSPLPDDDVELPKLVFIPRRLQPYNKHSRTSNISQPTNNPLIEEKTRVQHKHHRDHNKNHEPPEPLEGETKEHELATSQHTGTESRNAESSHAQSSPHSPDQDQNDYQTNVCSSYSLQQTTLPVGKRVEPQPCTAKAASSEPIIFPSTSINILSEILQDMAANNPYVNCAKTHPVNYYNLKRSHPLPVEYRTYKPMPVMTPSGHPMNAKKRLGNGDIYDGDFRLRKTQPIDTAPKNLLNTRKRLGNRDSYDKNLQLYKPPLNFTIPKSTAKTRGCSGNRDSFNKKLKSQEMLSNSTPQTTPTHTWRRPCFPESSERDLQSTKTVLTYTGPTCSLSAGSRPGGAKRYSNELF